MPEDSFTRRRNQAGPREKTGLGNLAAAPECRSRGPRSICGLEWEVFSAGSAPSGPRFCCPATTPSLRRRADPARPDDTL